jgi:hypothetical protein
LEVSAIQRPNRIVATGLDSVLAFAKNHFFTANKLSIFVSSRAKSIGLVS